MAIKVKKISVYKFTCTGCGKKDRQSIKERRAKNGLCRTCRSMKIDPNQ